jgi:hypothetical protein
MAMIPAPLQDTHLDWSVYEIGDSRWVAVAALGNRYLVVSGESERVVDVQESNLRMMNPWNLWSHRLGSMTFKDRILSGDMEYLPYKWLVSVLWGDPGDSVSVVSHLTTFTVRENIGVFTYSDLLKGREFWGRYPESDPYTTNTGYVEEGYAYLDRVVLYDDTREFIFLYGMGGIQPWIGQLTVAKESVTYFQAPAPPTIRRGREYQIPDMNTALTTSLSEFTDALLEQGFAVLEKELNSVNSVAVL